MYSNQQSIDNESLGTWEIDRCYIKWSVIILENYRIQSKYLIKFAKRKMETMKIIYQLW